MSDRIELTDLQRTKLIQIIMAYSVGYALAFAGSPERMHSKWNKEGDRRVMELFGFCWDDDTSGERYLPEWADEEIKRNMGVNA